MSSVWQSIAKRKQEERESRIPKEWRLSTSSLLHRDNLLDVPRLCGLLSDHELHITEDFDATSLLAALAQGSLRSEEVVLAFCKRAAIAQQATNCLTEILFEDGLARARELDSYFQRTGKPFGPLHGLPISLKDTFNIKGYDASLGVASLCFNPAKTNSTLVDQLLSLGAVLYCKTNVPQTMMALDSHNNVFGRTLNPANKNVTAGGSSGGEGALIAMHGSILGIGTDVGGSIRIPAACNGLYGVKPSHGRVPYAGQQGVNKPGSSKISIETTAGPIATTIRDCELLLRVIANSDPTRIDPDIIPQVWDQQNTSSEDLLRVGVVRSDGHVKPLPPVQRLMEEVVQGLKASGRRIEIIEIDAAPILSRIVKAFNGILSIDGGNAWFDHLEKTGEPLSPWLQGRLTRRAQKSIDDVLSLQAQRSELQTAFLSVWDRDGGHWLSRASEAPLEGKVDALILPVAPHPIAPIDHWNSANYTAAFNFLDLPAGVLPVRQFTERDLSGEVPDTKPLNGWDKINRELWTKVDRKVYLNSSLPLQIVTPRLTERRLVEIMATIDKALEPLRANETAKHNSKL